MTNASDLEGPTAVHEHAGGIPLSYASLGLVCMSVLIWRKHDAYLT